MIEIGSLFGKAQKSCEVKTIDVAAAVKSNKPVVVTSDVANAFMNIHFRAKIVLLTCPHIETLRPSKISGKEPDHWVGAPMVADLRASIVALKEAVGVIKSPSDELNPEAFAEILKEISTVIPFRPTPFEISRWVASIDGFLEGVQTLVIGQLETMLGADKTECIEKTPQ